jgi:hypothetical protein
MSPSASLYPAAAGKRCHHGSLRTFGAPCPPRTRPRRERHRRPARGSAREETGERGEPSSARHRAALRARGTTARGTTPRASCDDPRLALGVCTTSCQCVLSLRPSLNCVCEKRATAPYTRSGSRRALRSASELAARLLPCALLGRLPSTLLCGLLLGTLSRCHTISSSCGVNHPTDPPVERRARFRSSRLEAGANGPDKARPWTGARNRSANPPSRRYVVSQRCANIISRRPVRPLCYDCAETRVQRTLAGCERCPRPPTRRPRPRWPVRGTTEDQADGSSSSTRRVVGEAQQHLSRDVTPDRSFVVGLRNLVRHESPSRRDV